MHVSAHVHFDIHCAVSIYGDPRKYLVCIFGDQMYTLAACAYCPLAVIFVRVKESVISKKWL